jgi:hypothetical protein
LTQMEDGIPIYKLATPHLADARLRLGVLLRCAPHSMCAAASGIRRAAEHVWCSMSEASTCFLKCSISAERET